MPEALTEDDGLGAGPVLVLRTATLPPDPSSPGAARRLLLDALTEADRLQWLDGAALALSEVVTNAALHAHTPVEVTLEVRADRLSVEVRDGNPALPEQRRYDEQATTGRGLALVAAVTDECGVHSLGALGKVVWFSLGDGGAEQSADDLLAAWDLDGDWTADDASPPADAEDDGPAPAPQTATVVLEALPPALWLAARQHHDAVLRELVLYLAEHHDVQVDLALAGAARGLVSAALALAVQRAREAGTVRSVLPPGHPGSAPLVPDSLSLTLAVPVTVGPAYAALLHALEVGEELAAAGLLLARPGLPEVVAVREWAYGQVIAQVAGRPASPWPGTAQPRFETAVAPARGDVPWADGPVSDAEGGAVAADEANRIVAISRPLADLLGWEVDDLVGRRVVTLIPPRLREAHVAGFTRHLTTGESHVLGVPLVLPVLHRDGSEVACRFLIERAPYGARSVYVAWIEPVPAA